MTTLQAIYNFIELDHRLGTAGQPKQDQLAAIAEAGYQCVINLAMTDQDYALADEKGSVEALGMQYRHIPVIWQNPTAANFEEFCRLMEQYQENKVFIHCAANMRASVFMALYRIIHLGWEPEAAYRDLRRIWTPEGLWKDFMNRMLAAANQPPVDF
jgi:uncharacterized protein (TIGR01244 family)